MHVIKLCSQDCQKCAPAEHGQACIREFVSYEYDQNAQGDKVCKDSTNSCNRALCECDLQFAKAHAEKFQVFNVEFHLFWTTLPNGWEPHDSCPRSGNGPHDPQCCQRAIRSVQRRAPCLLRRRRRKGTLLLSIVSSVF